MISLALFFDFPNGFDDPANIGATIITTGAPLRSGHAFCAQTSWAAVILGAALVGGGHLDF